MSTTLAAYTILHVVISLVAIFAGIVVLYGMLSKQQWDGWTKLFLATTVLTSLTGFFFPYHGFTPAIGTALFRWSFCPSQFTHGMRKSSPAAGGSLT